jgi:hypothetical protein
VVATNQEIGDAAGMTPQGVGEVLKEFPDLEKFSKSDKSLAEHATDFDPPIYNIWKQQTQTSGSSKHFARAHILITWGMHYGERWPQIAAMALGAMLEPDLTELASRRT